MRTKCICLPFTQCLHLIEMNIYDIVICPTSTTFYQVTESRDSRPTQWPRIQGDEESSHSSPHWVQRWSMRRIAPERNRRRVPEESVGGHGGSLSMKRHSTISSRHRTAQRSRPPARQCKLLIDNGDNRHFVTKIRTIQTLVSFLVQSVAMNSPFEPSRRQRSLPSIFMSTLLGNGSNNGSRQMLLTSSSKACPT